MGDGKGSASLCEAVKRVLNFGFSLRVDTAGGFIEDEDASILLLQEDGSTGLDLSFATHLFLLDQIRDPALESQIISRAHRMGASGPVDVTLLLANQTREDAEQEAKELRFKKKKDNSEKAQHVQFNL